MSVPHYPKIWSVGNDAIENLFKSEVEITEKVDGSMFGFGVDENSEVVMRSKGKQLYFESFDNMFEEAVKSVEDRKDLLVKMANVTFKAPFFVYAEYLRKRKHNVLAYGRVPKDNLIVFGVKVGKNFIRDYDEIQKIADSLGLETVPIIYKGVLDNDRIIKSQAGNVDQIKKFGNTRYDRLQAMVGQTMSILGDQIIEGVVIKNYTQLTTIGEITCCFGKHVREAFKERLHKEWKSISGKNKEEEFIDTFRSETRWEKAVQHLRDRGELENSPRDIGKLMKEVPIDIFAEEKAEIEKFAFKLLWDKVRRKAIAGLPLWYKEQLLKRQCEDK